MLHAVQVPAEVVLEVAYSNLGMRCSYYHAASVAILRRAPLSAYGWARTVSARVVSTQMTNTRNTPTEALERSFPMRVLRARLRTGSGGAGAAQGGDGIERELLMLENVTVSLITERRMSSPAGLAGGDPGAVGENWLLPGGDATKAQPLLDKCTVRLRAGDVLRLLTPGGGGWGRPAFVRPMARADVTAVQAVEQAAGELFRSHPDPRIAACADHDSMTEDELAEQGAPAVTLTTFRDVPWNAPFYERRGFRVLDESGLSAVFDRLLDEEGAAYGLPRELRVVMRQDQEG